MKEQSRESDCTKTPIASWLFLPSFLYSLTVFFVYQALHLEIPICQSLSSVTSFPLIWYKKIGIPKLGDQAMSVFLYNVALDCSCLLSYTPWRFSSYLKLCISEFWSVNLRIKLASLVFSCTTSLLIVPAFFLILPYGFRRISSFVSLNSDL